MTTSVQNELTAILALIEENSDVRPVTRKRFLGTRQDDFYFARPGNSTAEGRGGNDSLIGKQGNDRLSGDKGNDLVMGGDGQDTIAGGNGLDTLSGDSGADQMDGGNGSDFMDGGLDTDTLIGGTGNDQLVGGAGVDNLTGGADSDQFIYNGGMFENGTPNPPGLPGIRVLNQPDLITDYTIGQDKFVFDKQSTNINNILFQSGSASQIANGNVIVLRDSFIAAGAAARAIANNANVVEDEGIFVYFNSTLGLTRVVYSQDLSDGGKISVLANLDNQRGQVGIDNLPRFTSADFALM